MSTHRDGRVAFDVEPSVLGGDGGHPTVVEGGADLRRVLDGDLAARVRLEVLLDLVVAEHAVFGWCMVYGVWCREWTRVSRGVRGGFNSRSTPCKTTAHTYESPTMITRAQAGTARRAAAARERNLRIVEEGRGVAWSVVCVVGRGVNVNMMMGDGWVGVNTQPGERTRASDNDGRKPNTFRHVRCAAGRPNLRFDEVSRLKHALKRLKGFMLCRSVGGWFGGRPHKNVQEGDERRLNGSKFKAQRTHDGLMRGLKEPFSSCSILDSGRFWIPVPNHGITGRDCVMR